MRKIILIVLLCTFCLEVIHADVEWNLSEDGTLIISGGKMDDYENEGSSTAATAAPWLVQVGFFHRDKIKKIIIKDGVTNIGNNAFMGCAGLISVEIPNSVTRIGEGAFESCKSITTFNIPNSVTSIGPCAFEMCTNLSLITFPNSVTSIGEMAFSGCRSLTSVTIPTSVTSIGGGAFSNCTGLTTVTIPNSVTTIEHATFSNCPKLTSVVIPNSVTNIKYQAFQSCTGLTSVTIPSTVTSIEYRAFSGCSSLATLICYAVEPPVGEFDFWSSERGLNLFAQVPTSTGTLYVPASAISAYKAADQWKEWKNIKAIEDGVTTGLRYVVDEKTADERMYNLNGQRINRLNAPKGIYIKNGKKYAR